MLGETLAVYQQFPIEYNLHHTIIVFWVNGTSTRLMFLRDWNTQTQSVTVVHGALLHAKIDFFTQVLQRLAALQRTVTKRTESGAIFLAQEFLDIL